jgi:hypothetical protein
VHGNNYSRREFFLDDDGVMYRRHPSDKHQIVVPRSLISEVVKENHDSVYIAHPGINRTCNLITLLFGGLV